MLGKPIDDLQDPFHPTFVIDPCGDSIGWVCVRLTLVCSREDSLVTTLLTPAGSREVRSDAEEPREGRVAFERDLAASSPCRHERRGQDLFRVGPVAGPTERVVVDGTTMPVEELSERARIAIRTVSPEFRVAV